MPKFEFAVRAYDQPDNGEHKRSKKGDFIAYKPYPHEWGKMEKAGFLHVIIDGITEEEARKLCSPQYDDGKYEQDINNPSPIIAKRRHKIDLTALKDNFYPELKLADVEDATKEYQPLKENDVVVTVSATKPVIYDKVSNKNITDIKAISSASVEAIEK